MSLIRQIRALLVGVVLLAIAGGITLNVLSARDALQAQLKVKNSDNAQSLALVLSQQRGDAQLMALLMSAQFDTGSYSRIRLVRADGAPGFDRQGEPLVGGAPAWFRRLVPIASPTGVAQVSDGWKPLGALEVVSQVAYAHDELWRGALQGVAWMLGLGALAAALAGVVVRRIQRALDAAVRQADALVDGRYVTVDEPRVPELRRLTAAMNGMVQRMRALFDAQAAQIETLRRQAHCDPGTGLPHRAHFLERLHTQLNREDGADGGGLVLVRLADPAALNLSLGREATDRALGCIAQALQAYPERAPECFVGRLNGSDFALAMPAAAGVAAETAAALAQALRSSLPAIGPGVLAHLGAVELARGVSAGALLAQADHALARAEHRGAFAAEVVTGAAPAQGERTWRTQVAAALHERRVRLMEYPVVDRHGALLHFECPLRVQLESGGVFEPAARWLPLAVRARLTGQVDGQAVALALEAIDRDGLPRGVNLAAASLADSGFATRLRALLQSRPALARLLWLEVGEDAAVDHFLRVQEFASLVRPLGVRFGLEHAGDRLAKIDRLFELGIDYVKLDAHLCAGVARNPAARDYVASAVVLLHALSVRVQAEGVADGADLQTLWACGIDGATGPAVRL